MNRILLLLILLVGCQDQPLPFQLSMDYGPNLDPQTQILRNWGLDNNEYHSHISGRPAWGLTQGSHDVIVAVIDSGIDAEHPALKSNLWHKPGTDEYGWDFVLNQKNPQDTLGHGTHVAGIIAARNLNTGVSGVAPNVQLMVLRYYSPTATYQQNIANTVKAIDYAIDHGAKIINYSSSGGTREHPAEKAALERAGAHGILVVTAAGNNGLDLDQFPEYPAAYSRNLNNVIAVAASSIQNKLIPESNFSKDLVQLAAPGQNIFSTLPGNRYGYLTGTSQASPFVTGVAALLLSLHPHLTPAELKTILTASADQQPDLLGKTSSGGRLNAFAALHAVDHQQRTSTRVLATSVPNKY